MDGATVESYGVPRRPVSSKVRSLQFTGKHAGFNEYLVVREKSASRSRMVRTLNFTTKHKIPEGDKMPLFVSVVKMCLLGISGRYQDK